MKKERIIPVVVLKTLEDTLPTLCALRDGGIGIAEITFRTECAAEAIALARDNLPDMTIGAGTVINAAQCMKALDSGAEFIVSPGLDGDVAAICKKAGVQYFPGCATPTEIMQAISLGIEVVKFFPANIYGGIKGVKALSAPFPSVKFLPTGGVDISNLAEYLTCPSVYAVGGTWMLKGDTDAITRMTREAVEAVKLCDKA